MVCFHTIKEKDVNSNLNDFSLFVSKSAIEFACARANRPPEKASRHAGYNRNYRIEDFANVRSRKRAWTPVIWSFPVKLLPSLEGLGVGGLIDNLTWWRHIRARYAQPPLQNLVRTPMLVRVGKSIKKPPPTHRIDTKGPLSIYSVSNRNDIMSFWLMEVRVLHFGICSTLYMGGTLSVFDALPRRRRPEVKFQ